METSLMIFNDANLGSQFISFTAETHEDRVKLFNAINAPTDRLQNFINTPLKIRDVIVSVVKLAEKNDDDSDKSKGKGKVKEDEENPFINEPKKMHDVYRVILLDAEGKSYTATSVGIYNSIQTLYNVFGTLHFEDGLDIIVRQKQLKNGNTLTINLI